MLTIQERMFCFMLNLDAKNVIVEDINYFMEKNIKFSISIKTDATIKRYLFNEDGSMNEIIEGKFYEDGMFMDILFVDNFRKEYNVVYSQGTGFLIFNGVIWDIYNN